MYDKANIDIEELKKSYAELLERERKFREMIEKLPETIYEIDLEGNLTYVNEAGLRLFGLSDEGFAEGINIEELFPPHEFEKIRENIRQTFEGVARRSTEYRAVKKDGTEFPVLTHSHLILKNNMPDRIRGILIDLTENYKIRKQLERERNFVNSLLDTANSLIICLDKNENILVFNKECERLTGYKFEEVKGKNWPQIFLPPEYRRKSDLPFSEWVKLHPEDRYEYPVLTKSGEVKIIFWSNNIFTPPDSNEMVALAVGHDITEQIKAAKALEESERHYRAVWDNLPVGICLTDRAGVYHYVNPAYCQIYGYREEDLIGRTPDGLISPPGDSEERRKLREDRFDRRTSTPLSEQEFLRSDGTPVWIQVASDFLIENDQPKYLISINIDITKRKTAESALKESESRYDLLFQYVDIPIFTVNKEGIFEMINRAAAGYLGGVPDDFIGKTMWDLFPRKIARRQMNNILKTLEGSKPMSEESFTYVGGEKKWFRTGIYPMKGTKGRIPTALLIARDITSQIYNKLRVNARFKLLDKLREAEKIDNCLELGCQAILDAQLYKRAVLTFHNEKREIMNLGQVGLERKTVDRARKAKAPDNEFAKQITQSKFRISNSYFVPSEAGFDFKSTERYVPGKSDSGDFENSWQKNDELFVPVFNQMKKIEGWLSVDTPFSGKRPDLETVRFLEEICDIVKQRTSQIVDRDKLASDGKELQEKNIALKEILGSIEEEKAGIRHQISENIERAVLPILNRITENSGNVNKSDLTLLEKSLKDLGALSRGAAQLYSKLSTREIEICNLIKMDSTSKEIANSLNISIATVHKHREAIRRKLGLTNKEYNLRSYLKTLETS
jgi:PAS domain S-box-containing protein